MTIAGDMKLWGAQKYSARKFYPFHLGIIKAIALVQAAFSSGKLMINTNVPCVE